LYFRELHNIRVVKVGFVTSTAEITTCSSRIHITMPVPTEKDVDADIDAANSAKKSAE